MTIYTFFDILFFLWKKSIAEKPSTMIISNTGIPDGFADQEFVRSEFSFAP